MMYTPYRERKPPAPLEQVADVRVRYDREIIISKFLDGDGYKIGVRQHGTDRFGKPEIKFLKGAVTIPSSDKLYELAMKLLDIATEQEHKNRT